MFDLLPRALVLFLLFAPTVRAQNLDRDWDEHYRSRLTDRTAVLTLFDEARACGQGAAVAFLENRGRTWPRGAYAEEALAALGRIERIDFIGFILGLARRAPRDSVKVGLWGHLESAPAHRERGLPHLVSLTRRHKSEPIGADLLDIVIRYLEAPAGITSRSRVVDLLFDLYTDADAKHMASGIWDCARKTTVQERRPFLVRALESLDGQRALEAAAELLDQRAPGADDLLIEMLCRDVVAADRIGLWAVLARPRSEVLWLEILSSTSEMSWEEIDHVRRWLVREDNRNVGAMLSEALRTGADVRLSVLALGWFRRRKVGHIEGTVRRALVESDDPRVKIAAAEALAEITGDATWWERGTRYLEASRFDDRLERLEAVMDIRLRSNRMQAWIRETLKKTKRWELMAHLLRAAPSCGFEDLSALAAPFVEHDRWQVRLAAIECFVAAADRLALPHLAQATGEKRERLARLAADGLARLTGRDYGTAPDSWRRYVAKLPASWRPVPPGHRREKIDRRYGPAFYGLDLRSNFVIFVCDVSGSMEGTKIETLSRELVKVTKAIRKPGGFNLVFFSDHVHEHWPSLRSGTPGAHKSARERAGRLIANGGTNLWGGLETALKDTEADTIVILTDGQPSKGRFQDPQRILQQTHRLNRARRMQIHTIFVAQNAGALEGSNPFLTELAANNDGLYLMAD